MGNVGRPRQLNMQKCVEDFSYYSRNLLKIKDKDSNLVPFDLWDPQIQMHRLLEGLREKNELQRIIVLKVMII